MNNNDDNADNNNDNNDNDRYGLAAPQFSTCEVTLHEHYQLNTGFAIQGGGAPK
jgi:hypothetical protein